MDKDPDCFSNLFSLARKGCYPTCVGIKQNEEELAVCEINLPVFSSTMASVPSSGGWFYSDILRILPRTQFTSFNHLLYHVI